jgi:hypothetical protein
MEESARVSRCTLSDLEYSEVPPLFTGAQEELLNTPKAGKFWTFIMTGAIDTFTTEAEAKHGFLQQAQKWVDDRLDS